VKNPLAFLTLFFSAGIICAHCLRPGFWPTALFSAGVFIFACLVFYRKRLCSVLILGLALLLGGLSLINFHQLPREHLRNFVDAGNDLFYRVSGFVLMPPVFQNGYYYFVLQAQAVQAGGLKFTCCGKLLIRMEFEEFLNYGERLSLAGQIKRHKSVGQEVNLIMAVKDARQIIREGGFGGAKITREILKLRSHLESIIRQQLPRLPAGILCAMVLGQQQNVPWAVRNAMVESGTVHILVVSGFNVGIVAFIANLLLKFLRLPRRLRVILVGVNLIIYCLLTGASNPVVRATIMGLIYLGAYFLRRDPDIFNSLFCAALLILTVRPGEIFDLGFELSFASVLAIIYFYPRLKRWLRPEQYQNRMVKFFIEGGLVSFAAWLGTCGILAFNFRMVTPVTVLANLVVVPLATLITLCGFAMLLVGLACPGLAEIFSLPAAALITILLNLNTVLARLPLACIYF